MQDQKKSTSVSLEIGQLQRLARISERTRIVRSVIVRDALERELQRYEAEEAQKKAAAEGGGVIKESATSGS